MVDLFLKYEPISLIVLLREVVNLGCDFDKASHPAGAYVDFKKVLVKCEYLRLLCVRYGLGSGNAHAEADHGLRESRAFLLWHLGRTQDALSVLLDDAIGDL